MLAAHAMRSRFVTRETVGQGITGIIAFSGNRDRTGTGAQSPHVSVVRGFAASSLVTRRSRGVIPFRRLPLIRFPVPGGVVSVEEVSP